MQIITGRRGRGWWLPVGFLSVNFWESSSEAGHRIIKVANTKPFPGRPDRPNSASLWATGWVSEQIFFFFFLVVGLFLPPSIWSSKQYSTITWIFPRNWLVLWQHHLYTCSGHSPISRAPDGTQQTYTLALPTKKKEVRAYVCFSFFSFCFLLWSIIEARNPLPLLNTSKRPGNLA